MKLKDVVDFVIAMKMKMITDEIEIIFRLIILFVWTLQNTIKTIH